MGRIEAVTGNTNDATGGSVGVSAIAQKDGKLPAAALAHRAPVSNTDKD
jgi:hypothetical protein